MKSILFFLILFIGSCLLGCSVEKDSKADSLPFPTPIYPKKDLSEIDLSVIEHIAKDRAQDGALEDKEFKTLPIAGELLAHGKDSIPFLIGKLDDETEMSGDVIDFWYEVYVGDIALIILQDFFMSSDGLNSTVKGMNWDEFLERGNDKHLMGEEVLRRYIKKHGRKKIKARWQKFWNENKENIIWDEAERCFKLKKSQNELLLLFGEKI